VSNDAVVVCFVYRHALSFYHPSFSQGALNATKGSFLIFLVPGKSIAEVNFPPLEESLTQLLGFLSFCWNLGTQWISVTHQLR